MHGLFVMRERELKAAYKRAMRIGAFAAAERIVFQMNEPGKLYSYQFSKGAGTSENILPKPQNSC